MITIAPSLLAANFLRLEEEIEALNSIDNLWLHLDVMDGHFVPNLTFGTPIIKQIAKVSKVKLDAHFMVTNAEFYLDFWKDIPLHNFTFHYEACQNPLEFIRDIKKHFPCAGMSIKPGTSIEAISDEILKEIDLLLVMSVEPGFGGQSFIEDTYDKLSKIKNLQKKLGTNFIVQVDGGVSDQNARKLYEHGANNLVAGSYVFKEGSKNYQPRIEKLRDFV